MRWACQQPQHVRTSETGCKPSRPEARAEGRGQAYQQPTANVSMRVIHCQHGDPYNLGSDLAPLSVRNKDMGEPSAKSCLT